MSPGGCLPWRISAPHAPAVGAAVAEDGNQQGRGPSGPRPALRPTCHRVPGRAPVICDELLEPHGLRVLGYRVSAALRLPVELSRIRGFFGTTFRCG